MAVIGNTENTPPLSKVVALEKYVFGFTNSVSRFSSFTFVPVQTFRSMAADLGLFRQGLHRRKSQSTAKIYIDDLLEEYTCPICFDEIACCRMTPCGHNFCKECIEECLNRKYVLQNGHPIYLFRCRPITQNIPV